MQDPETGELERVVKAADGGGFNFKDTGLPAPEGRPVFYVGELVLIRGGWFRVHGIRAKKLILKGVPRKTAEAEIEARKRSQQGQT